MHGKPTHHGLLAIIGAHVAVLIVIVAALHAFGWRPHLHHTPWPDASLAAWSR